MLLIGNGRLLTRDKARPYFENGAVATEGNKILEVGDFDALREKYRGADFLDARGASDFGLNGRALWVT